MTLAACAPLSGDPATGFLTPEIRYAFIPLNTRVGTFEAAFGAAVVIGPGVAVTNAHNAEQIPDAKRIAVSANYDLLYFRTDRSISLATTAANTGENVVAYGDDGGRLRMAHGIVRDTALMVESECAGCARQRTFTYESNAGPGFSGGPVIDAGSGKLLGITYGFRDMPGRRLMYAYPIDLVLAELARFNSAAAPAQH